MVVTGPGSVPGPGGSYERLVNKLGNRQFDSCMYLEIAWVIWYNYNLQDSVARYARNAGILSYIRYSVEKTGMSLNYQGGVI